MVSKVKFNLQTDVTGMEELSRLINRVDALEKRMQSYAGRTVPAAAKASQKFAGQLQVQSKAARRAQLGAQQFGMQINDLSTSITTGANPMIALNQQLGQIGFALGQMEGKLKKVGMVLGGVWGAAIGLAGMALYQLWENTRDTEEAVVELSDAFDVQAASVKDLTEYNRLLAESNEEVERTSIQATAAIINKSKADVVAAQTRLTALQEVAAATVAEIERGGRGAENAGIGALFSVDLDELEELNTTIESSQTRLEKANAKLFSMTYGMDEASSATEALKQRLNLLQDQAGEIGFDAVRDEIAATKEALAAFEQTSDSTAKSAGRAAKVLTELDVAKAGVEIRAAMLVAQYRAGAISAEEFMSANYGLSASLRNAEEAAKPASKQMETIAKRLDRANKEARAAKKAVKEFLDAGREPIEGPVEEFDLPQMLTDERIKQSVEGFKAIQQAAQNVGRAVSDSFARMLSGASSWKDGMRGIIRAVIDQLWQLYVVQQIVGFITSAIGGLGLPSPGASPVGSTASGIGGFRERGGPVQAGTAYVVGEKRPELFIPGTSGTIVPNTDAMSGGGGAVINVDARGATDPEAVRMQVERGILEAAPQIIAASEARTIRTLRRPRLAGGSF